MFYDILIEYSIICIILETKEVDNTKCFEKKKQLAEKKI